MSEAKLKQLAEVVGDAGEILILPHKNPDPDARALQKPRLNFVVEFLYNGN